MQTGKATQGDIDIINTALRDDNVKTVIQDHKSALDAVMGADSSQLISHAAEEAKKIAEAAAAATEAQAPSLGGPAGAANPRRYRAAQVRYPQVVKNPYNPYAAETIEGLSAALEVASATDSASYSALSPTSAEGSRYEREQLVKPNGVSAETWTDVVELNKQYDLSTDAVINIARLAKKYDVSIDALFKVADFVEQNGESMEDLIDTNKLAQQYGVSTDVWIQLTNLPPYASETMMEMLSQENMVNSTGANASDATIQAAIDTATPTGGCIDFP
jgi:hypothetical protein